MKNERIGLCLPGGGAKGAFQAGALKRVFEHGIKPLVITGTSIGAVNSYYLMKGRLEELYDVWNRMEGGGYRGKHEMVVDNSGLIRQLAALKGDNKDIEGLYINYVGIQNKQLEEIVVEISRLEEAIALEAVKYSSLLPFNAEDGENQEDALARFDSQLVFERFKKDVSNGVYDGWKLDGGILNNNLLSPFINNRVDKIIIIPLKDCYRVPEYILDYYENKDILIIDPDFPVMPQDTLRFEGEYCRDMFTKGYKRATEVLCQSIKSPLQGCCQ